MKGKPIVMKNVLLFYLMAILFGCTCDEHSPAINACTSDESDNEIPWLSDLKSSINNCTCTTSLMKGTYQSKAVYFVLINDPLCNVGGSVVLYNCEGEPTATIDVAQFGDHVQIDTILYTCDE
jgi:hypothetical protein